jgi:hypothetical protein
MKENPMTDFRLKLASFIYYYCGRNARIANTLCLGTNVYYNHGRSIFGQRGRRF